MLDCVVKNSIMIFFQNQGIVVNRLFSLISLNFNRIVVKNCTIWKLSLHLSWNKMKQHNRFSLSLYPNCILLCFIFIRKYHFLILAELLHKYVVSTPNLYIEITLFSLYLSVSLVNNKK